MNVLGIDHSLAATAVFVLDDSGREVACRVFGSEAATCVSERVLRNYSAVSRIQEFITPFNAELVCIEQYSYGSNTAQHSAIIEHGYELRRMLCGLGFHPRIVEVAPKSLKKHATGSGKGDKTGVVAAMARRFPNHEFTLNDEADAAALALIAWQLAGCGTPGNQAQREVIAKIEAGPVKKPRKART